MVFYACQAGSPLRMSSNPDAYDYLHSVEEIVGPMNLLRSVFNRIKYVSITL